MQNNETGNAWTLHILGELSESWPKRVDFNSEALKAVTEVGPDDEEAAAELFDDLLKWLMDEGFVQYSQTTEGAVYDLQITSKAMDAIGHAIPTEKGSAGATMKSMAASAGTTAGQAVITETIGQLIGAALRGWTGAT